MANRRLFTLGEPFAEPDRADLGGKGARLAELAALRYNVPPGFVVPIGALHEFWNANATRRDACRTLVASAELDAPEALEQTARRLREQTLGCTWPADLAEAVRTATAGLPTGPLAVRSSAGVEDGRTKSFAGLFQTCLNVTREGTLAATQVCCASQFTSRSLAYLLDGATSATTWPLDFAIIVQHLVKADVSGVCFTRDPVIGDANLMVIETAWGLGEALVGGDVIPDTHVFDKQLGRVVRSDVQAQPRMRVCGPPGQVVWREVAARQVDRPKLNDRQLRELCEVCIDLEQTFDCGCDVEWAICGELLFILQCRPITTTNA